MVETQLSPSGIRDKRVIAAMLAVPREHFVPEAKRVHAYEPCALAIGEGQTISQPFMVARALELLQLRGDERVLEIGAGSGYQAALLGVLAKEVVAIERLARLAIGARTALRTLATQHPELEDAVRRVVIVTGDGSLGHAERAPFDRIVVSAGASSVPRPLLDQLADGGMLVAPLGDPELQRLTVIERSGERFHQETYDACIYVPLVGEGELADPRTFDA